MPLGQAATKQNCMTHFAALQGRDGETQVQVVVASDTGRGVADTPFECAAEQAVGFSLAGNLLLKPPPSSVVRPAVGGAFRDLARKQGVTVMSFRKHTIWSVALGTCMGLSALAQEARACGGEWYPEVMIDPRIHGVAQAEKSLANGNRLAAAASVIRMMPHIKSLKSKPGSLVARAERVLAVALSRSQGGLPVGSEVPLDVLGVWQGAKDGERAANLAWSVEVLERQSDTKSDDVALKTDLAEAMARVPERRADARTILEDLAKRDLIASPEGYAALAVLRSQSGDADGQKLALKRCEAMAKSQDACLLRS
jgi:hypothetical protein